MISSQMKEYNYSFYTQQENKYGEKIKSERGGTVKMAINLLNNQIADNILYKTANYIGLSYSSDINDTWIIEYGNEKLKVLYVVPNGRIKQVFMAKV